MFGREREMAKGQAVEIDKAALQKIVEADTFSKMTSEEKKKYQDIYDLNCNIRELQVFKLLQKVVADMNGLLKGRPEKLRLFDEGNGLFLELGL
jgi:hypothetical protein